MTSHFTGGWSTAASQHIIGILPIVNPHFLSLVITTNERDSVNFNVNSINGSLETSGRVTDGESVSITTLMSYMVGSSSERNKGLRVSTESGKKVSVNIGLNTDSFSAGAYQIRPVWGYPINSYVYYAVSVTSNGPDGSGQVEGAFSTLLIVGANKDTDITITPTVTITIPPDLSPTGNATQLAPNNSMTFQMNYLETFLITPVNPLDDLTGTKVESNKPIAIYSGHSDGYIPTTTYASDFVGDQLHPVASWGNSFIISPFFRRPSGYILKLIASQSNTSIRIRCNDNANYLLTIERSGGFINQSIGQQSCYINSSSPIQVAQFSLVQLLDSIANLNYGDPGMIIIPPTHHYTNNVTFPVIKLQVASTYMNLAVIAKCTSISEAIRVNGNVTFNSVQNWTSVYENGYSLSGHTLNSDSTEVYSIWTVNPNDRLFPMIYGQALFVTYVYTGGMNILPFSKY